MRNYESIPSPQVSELKRFVKYHSRRTNVAMHLSYDSDLQIRARHTYLNLDKRNGLKPKGICYSIGLDWIEWMCENLIYQSYKHIHVLEVNERALLRIDSVKTFDKICSLYRKINPGCDAIKTPSYHDKINWDILKMDYCGIEISPYLHSAAFKKSWYSAFNASSGCIWDISIIKSYKLYASYIDGRWVFV